MIRRKLLPAFLIAKMPYRFILQACRNFPDADPVLYAGSRSRPGGRFVLPRLLGLCSPENGPSQMGGSGSAAARVAAPHHA